MIAVAAFPKQPRSISEELTNKAGEARGHRDVDPYEEKHKVLGHTKVIWTKMLDFEL
jgi:hypothetical protein